MRKIILITFTFLVISGTYSQVPFNTSPSWISTDTGSYSTGLAWADINNDGWLDLIVANGNDIERQKVVVYYNSNGTIPTNPSWQSSDIDFNGHLSIGDVNHDGYPDVAVSVLFGPSGFNTKGHVKLYINNNGTLSSSPSWISKDSMGTFSCAFGDADGDGDLDLAVACGQAINALEKNRIYFNRNGILDSLPGWESKILGYSMDVCWADFNNDGRLDLAFVNGIGPNYMYLNYGDSIATVPSLISADSSQQANSCFAADVNNDGFIDLVVSAQNQFGSNTGWFKIYLNNAGTLSTVPSWYSSSFSGYGSGIALADVNNDNDLDLIGGGWWTACWVYLNHNGGFDATPQWTSSTYSVVEAIALADYDHDGYDTLNTQFSGNGSKKLFYLQRKPVQQFLMVRVGNDTLHPNQFCFDSENGWLSLAAAPPNSIPIYIKYIVSHDLDFAVSNWDRDIGNYIFINKTVIGINEISADVPRCFELYQNYPNPFNPTTKIKFEIPEIRDQMSEVRLVIYDILGREVATLVNEKLSPGTYEVEWNAANYPSGIYFYKLIIDNASTPLSITKRMVLLK